VIVDGIPFLGICLGMQLLFHRSDEGESTGLGWVGGQVKRFEFSSLNTGERLVVPHMGWNEVLPLKENLLLPSEGANDRFYFVHSYHAVDVPDDEALARCRYGYEFICAVQKGNILGVQFHPEKSHRFGKQLFKNFIEFKKC